MNAGIAKEKEVFCIVSDVKGVKYEHASCDVTMNLIQLPLCHVPVLYNGVPSIEVMSGEYPKPALM